MKIAYLTPEYPHKYVDNNSGGIGTSIYNLATGLKSKGCSVIILVYNQSKDEVIESREAIIYKIKNNKLKGLSWFLTRKKIENLINRLYIENKLDLIEAPDWTGITSLIKTLCPMVLKLHGSDTYFCHLEQRKSKWWNRFHEKRALRTADGYISVSKYTAQKTNEIFKTNIPFEIIPNCVNVEVFKPSKFENRKATKTILYLGTLIRKKGVLEIPHIFNYVIKEVPEAHLLMIGGDSIDVITKTSSTYQLMLGLFSDEALQKFKYLGKVSYHLVKRYLEEADVLIFPSFAEALPVSWLEAMAMEKLIVASNIGWAIEVIEHSVDGFLISPSDHRKFANSIIKILKSEVESKKISKLARQKITLKFSTPIVAEKNINYYKKVIHGKKS